MEEFKNITPEEGRQLVNQAGVLIFLEWDITDAVALSAIMKSKNPFQDSKEEVKVALQNSAFSEEYETLAI